MNKIRFSTLISMMIFTLLIWSGVSAQEQEMIGAASAVSEKVIGNHLIDAINEDDADGEIGLAYLGTATTIGYYKKCSTDAFFYTVIVNNQDKEVQVTLPRTVKINERYYYTDGNAYLCKQIPENGSGLNNFADADQGQACILQNNRLTIDPHSTISIRGKAINFSHELTHGNTIASDTEFLDFKFNIQINNVRKEAAGSLESKGTMCDGLNFLEVTPYNYVDGGYLLSASGSESCSMNYFFIAENSDLQYSTVVELPRWVELDGTRFDVGCKYLYPGCKISGFRHYAWGFLEDDESYTDPVYHFCDQDRGYGDLCFEENSLWWLRIPANTRIAVRGMVNDLCDVPAENPLRNSIIEIGFDVSDAGSNKWWLDGVVTGTEPKISDSKDADNSGVHSLLEERDKDEPVNRYLLEDPSLVDVLMAPAEPVIIEEEITP